MATNPKYKGIESLYEVEDERRIKSSATQVSSAREAGHATQAGPAREASPAKSDQQALPQAGHAREAGHATQAGHTSPSVDLLASLPAVGGFLKLSNQIVDKLLPQLEPYEQILYLQLYRLSHGNGKSFCLISMPKMAERTKISERTLWRAFAELKRKGLVTRGEAVHGRGKEQGITFWVATPAGPASVAGHDSQAGPATEADNKRKALKENIKKESELSLDTKNCPDCDGMGVRYLDPLDYSKGTVKCKHERMGK